MSAGLLPLAALSPPASAQQQRIEGLAATDVFVLADQARAEARIDEAETLYRALTRDPDPEIRAEAYFRLGMMLADDKRYTSAALAFRALLDEKPDAGPVRLELARILAMIGDERGARRELRQAQAGGLPADIALVVDQFTAALRSAKMFGGSFEFTLAPDSNINRATDAKMLDTVIAPLNLSEDARERSGLGVKMSGQGYARIRLDDGLSLLPRISGQTEFYREQAFNDVSGSMQLGLEWRRKKDRFTPSAGLTRRYYGGDLYARTQMVGLNWLHSAGPRAQIDGDISVSQVSYVRNSLQDGTIYSAGLSYERAFTTRSGGSVSLSGLRQTARDPGYASTSGGIAFLHWRDFGKMTLFGTATLRRLVSDERLFPFVSRRKEWYWRIAAGATFRQVQAAGFSPILRVQFERNTSTVGIYDYRRLAMDVGIARAF